ncbi:thiamine pyrophosphokinase [Siminovitchia terrae]|uniref:Thiamine diphosphokinase n=2 Tax=Siminovitchia terrae TaxID=1914933 RepID=A0ABQ4KST1_SIMTE|nr:thiamine pyrophosphokinase [Siminovitchia terrae]GIN94646.1 thiamine pyrophosphokinase [Siminovitchia terrae]
MMTGSAGQLKKTIHIVAGGPEPLIPDLSENKNENIVWIGVDRGVQTIMRAGLYPDLAVGDFDSISQEEWEKIEREVASLRRFKPEKDETDMELAIMWALEMNASTVKVFGGTGGRLDHFMANALMLAKFKQVHPDIHFEMIDVQNNLSVYLPGSYEIKQDRKKFVSFIPVFSDVSGVTLEGFKYPLNHHYVPVGSSLCISNELIQETGHFSFEKGILMMIRSKD